MDRYRFSDEANMHYTFTDADALVSDTKYILKFINHHMQHQQPRLKTLEQYYLGNNTSIFDGARRREEHQADHRAAHNFAKYVSDFQKGYLTGTPIKTNYTADNDAVNDYLVDVNRLNNADEHNAELVLSQSKFGRAYELVYRTDTTKFVDLSPLTTFVIYSDDVERSPLAGIRYIKNKFADKTIVTVYTAKEIITYETDISVQSLRRIGAQVNHFGDVPIIEYENNRDRQGDYEDVLSLIDLYDAAQSDTANYMTDFNDAMLKVVGNMDIEEIVEMKKANVIKLEPSYDEISGREGRADADYIYKKYDVAGTEAYKDRVFNDILFFTSVPNMNDENFSGTQSGVAMKYKLFALEQKRSTKERSFIRSLRQRYTLISNVASAASESTIDVNDIEIVFTPNLPTDIKEEMEWFNSSGGRLSQETLLSQLTFINNAREEQRKIDDESPQSIVSRDSFEFGYEESFKVNEDE